MAVLIKTSGAWILIHTDEGKIAVRDIMDEISKRILPYLELDEGPIALTEILSDDTRRAKAIQMLNAKLIPYRNRDFPPEITTAWLTKLYLKAKDRTCEHRSVIEDIRLDFKLGRLRRAHVDNYND